MNHESRIIYFILKHKINSRGAHLRPGWVFESWICLISGGRHNRRANILLLETRFISPT